MDWKRTGISHPPVRTRPIGFTLVELMITVVVLALASALAIPAFNRMHQTNRVRSVQDDLFRTLNYARSEAITRNQRVSICPKRANQLNCRVNAANTDNWDQGWLVWVDSNGNGSFQAEELLRMADAVNDYAKVRTSGTFNDLNLDFRPNGSADAITFSVCSRDNRVRQQVVISRTGRVRNGSAAFDDIDCNAP